MFATGRGGYNLEAIWMVDQIKRATLQSKKMCFIVSSWRQKTHFVLPFQLRLTKLSLVRITPRRAYHANILILLAFSSSKVSRFYQLACRVGLGLYTWNRLRIYRSH